MSRPLFCEVDLAALRHNYAKVKALAAGRGVWAVIKANAYGHGIAEAVKGFAQADGLAMLNFEDAVLCRQLGWSKPILMLEGAFSAADVALAQQLDLQLVVHQQRQVDWLLQASSPVTLHLHLKVNTGMNRLGFSVEQVSRPAEQLIRSNRCRALTWMTHFANSDLPALDQRGSYVDVNFQLDHLLRAMRTTGQPASEPELAQASVTNSAALVTGIQTPPVRVETAGWARPGIILYGATPFGEQTAAQLGFKPAMRLVSEIIAVQSLSPGDQVGYGSRFTAEQPMRIGVVACGYADGYPRIAKDGTPVWVAGQLTRLVGRVSMDMLTVDITHIPTAGEGSEVELWGTHVPIDDVAAGAQTIGYELMCAVAPRVKRRVIDSSPL